MYNYFDENGQGGGKTVGSILGLGFVDMALGILLMAPLSVGTKGKGLISTSFFLAFQVCVVVGMLLIAVAGLLAVLQ